jgi:hypothetical protein
VPDTTLFRSVVDVVEEGLRDQELRPQLHLTGHVREIVLQGGTLGVAFGITGRADAEVVAGGDQLDEVGGVGQAVGHRHESRLAPRRIAPQGHDVLHPAGGQAVEGLL